MLQIQPKNIIPITEARAKLDDLIDQAKGNNFFVISRQGKAKAALVDIDFLMDYEVKFNGMEMEKIHLEMQKSFREYLIKKGYDPDKMTDEEAEKILQKLSSGIK